MFLSLTKRKKFWPARHPTGDPTVSHGALTGSLARNTTGSFAAAEMQTRPCSGKKKKKKVMLLKVERQGRGGPVRKAHLSVRNPSPPSPPRRHSARPTVRLPIRRSRLGWGTPAVTCSCPTGTGRPRSQLAVILNFGLWMYQRVVAPLGFRKRLPNRVYGDGDSGEAEVLVPWKLDRSCALVIARLPKVAHRAQEGPAFPQRLGRGF